jgi:hypothetical protein
MIIVADLSNDYDTTIYDAARWFIAHGTDPSHMLEIRRDGKLSMSGIIGELAKWTVEFRASGPRLVPHRDCGIARLAAKAPPPAIVVPEPGEEALPPPPEPELERAIQ